ncbi:rust resistance kinase Lr10 [Rosa sericea]
MLRMRVVNLLLLNSSGNIQTRSFLGVFVPKAKGRDNQKCVPSSCGHIDNISYPFRLEHDPKHCGDSSYTLECNNNVTILRLYSGEYYVKEINYRNSTIRVVDPGLEKNNCASLPRFPLAQSNFSSLSFTYGPVSTPLTFLKCENPVHSSLYVDTASCIKSEAYGYVKVGTTTTSDLEDGCSIDSTTMITTFARTERNVSYKEIHKELVYGFQLTYEMTYVFVDCRRQGQWSSALGRCFPHSITGFFQLLWEFIYYDIVLPLYHLDDRFLLDMISIVPVVFTVKFILGAPFVIALLIYKWRRRHSSTNNTIEDFLHSDNFMPIRYTYSNIKKMSNGFKDKLGEGGYGSVFKAKLRSGRLGAIKLLGKPNANGEDFMSEVATIGRIHHINVVQLVGYCVEGSKRALVYDFMSNGSLDKCIYSKEGFNTLSCKKMYEIAVGVAHGIKYLHRGCEVQILHFDMKPHNILLDENFIPKISDFGLAKLYPRDNSIVSSMAARGTMGYIAPELFYKNIGGVSYKADVYSFGMLLMEMASKRKNVNALVENSSQIYFPSWVHDQYNEGKDFEIGDATTEEKQIIKKMIITALWCIQMKPSDRPSMKRAIAMLEGDVECLQMPLKPSLCPEPMTVGNLIPTSSDVELTCSLSAR